MENAWSQIDVQLKRRHDLIPNLINAVKGYMKYE
ncbi:MAG: LemA family protein [Candidatus Hydrothermales bacterium]